MPASKVPSSTVTRWVDSPGTALRQDETVAMEPGAEMTPRSPIWPPDSA